LQKNADTQMMLAVFDLCGTLFRCNTLFAFGRWACRRSFAVWLADSAPAKLFDMIFPSVRFRRRLFLFAIRRFDDRELAFLSLRFCRDLLPKYARENAIELLSALQKKGWTTLLITAAPDFLAKNIARMLGFSEWRASEYKNGVLTVDLTGDKLRIVKEYGPWEKLYAVTDNRSDLPLLRTANYRRIYCRRYHKWWLERFPKEEVFSD